MHDSVSEIADDPYGGGAWGQNRDWTSTTDSFQRWMLYILMARDWDARWFDSGDIDYRDSGDPDAAISVGSEGGPPEDPVQGDELSDLVISESEPAVPGPADDITWESGREQTRGTVVEVRAGTYGDDYWIVGDFGGEFTSAQVFANWGIVVVRRDLLEPTTDPETTSNGELDVPLHEEIFSDLGDAGMAFIHNLLGHPGHTHQDTFLDPGDILVNGNGGGGMNGNGNGAPPPPSGAGQHCATGASPVYKKVCGAYRWVYPKRRRRRALLTESDYNALLRIEGLKVNGNMKVAIAKALTR